MKLLLGKIPVEELRRQIIGDSDTSYFDVEECLWCCAVLIDNFIPHDFNLGRKLVSVEKPFVIQNVLEGTTDIEMYEKNGEKIVIDWKSADAATLDTAWKERYIYSWQWKIYCFATGAKRFIYRAISKTTGAIKEIHLQPDEDNDRQVINHLLSVDAMRQALGGMDVWPRHMPFACKAYGRECPFTYDCRHNTMPKFIPEMEPLHYTTSETFLLCPERYRRISKIDKESKENRNTAFGSALHRGMAYAYRTYYDFK